MGDWGPGAGNAQKSAIFEESEAPPRTREVRDTSETGTSHVRASRKIRPVLLRGLMAVPVLLLTSKRKGLRRERPRLHGFGLQHTRERIRGANQRAVA